MSTDPLAPAIEEAIARGWCLAPMVGSRENVLFWWDKGHTDAVTIPPTGYATVVRYVGGPPAGQPRLPAAERWRHRVPLDIALPWLLGRPDDDDALREWLSLRRSR